MTNPLVWPRLEYESLWPTVDYLNRLVQIGGKYTLDDLFEPGWGNVVLDVTPIGLRTPTLRQDGTFFSIHYRLLVGDVLIESDAGSRALALQTESVASFYGRFCAALSELGLRAPGSTLLCELATGYDRFESDTKVRSWDPAAARLVWQGFALVADGLRSFEAPYRGHRPRIGVMWGGFDLSSTRYRGVRIDPPIDRPAFLQHGMTEEYVSVGFFYGNPQTPEVCIYAYVAPQPVGMHGRDWGVDGARWDGAQGLVLLPYERLRTSSDPIAAIVDFGDAVYSAAVELAGWPGDLVGRRFSGWEASRTPPAAMAT